MNPKNNSTTFKNSKRKLKSRITKAAGNIKTHIKTRINQETTKYDQ